MLEAHFFDGESVYQIQRRLKAKRKDVEAAVEPALNKMRTALRVWWSPGRGGCDLTGRNQPRRRVNFAAPLVDLRSMPPTPATLASRNDPPTPKVDPEFKALIAPLTPQERSQLSANIAEEGCRDALVVWKSEGILIDGHNRLEICTRLRVPYATTEIDFPSREAAKLWIEENQIGRRNLSSDQRAAIAYRILQRRIAISKAERGRKGGLAGGSGRAKLSLVVTASTEQPQLRQREIAAAQLAVPSRKLRLISQIAKHSAPMLEQILAGTLTIKKAKDQLAEESRQSKRNAAVKAHPKGSGIYTGDLTLLNRLVADDSADLFLCDPPNSQDAVPLYGQLAEVASRKLKSGGLCVVTCGQMYLDRGMNEMAKHLQYYWLCAVSQTGNSRSSSVLARKVTSNFTPMLMFAKRPVPGVPTHPFLSDMILTDKKGQGVDQVRYFIEKLTEPGQLVVAPFCGDGAVPEACVATERNYIATEDDPGVAAAARARVAAFRKAQAITGSTSKSPKAHQRLIREELAKTEESFDCSIENAVVKEIAHAEAKAIIEKYEWLKTMPAFVIRCFGIFFDGICGGVVVYRSEYTENLHVWDQFEFTDKIICLARGVSLHWAHPHSASKLIRQSMKMLPEKYKVVTCTVDSQAGEVGIIYQACGYDYVGVMSKGGDRASIITPDGKQVSSRDAYTLFGTRSIKKLREMGLTVASVPRKSRYFAFIGSKKEKADNRKKIEHLIKPYPKRSA